jgi:hypothetical protein
VNNNGVTIGRIVSGGQTGADRGALDAALWAGVSHGGWCPAGRRAEDGPIPERYQLTETAENDYIVRTEANVRDSDATIVLTFGAAIGGSAATIGLTRQHARPVLPLDIALLDDDTAAAQIRRWLAEQDLADGLTLNVAGSRESTNPGLAERARQIVLRLLE